jgi:arginyl-tRNA synthetase
MFAGIRVESDTHLGDWGTQFGLLLLAYKKWGDIEVIKTNPIVELNKLYVQINAQLESEPELRDAGKQEFVKLEQGDEENTALWNQFKDWSWQEFEIMYGDVGIRRADHNWPESFYADKMPAVVEALKASGLLNESQGAQIVDLEAYGLGIAIIIKSDGGTTYLLRDLATYIYRKAEGFSKQLYVVDVRQSHTLAQTFKILELLGNITSADEAKHIGYGFMTLPEGAMSTRKGTVVGAKELIEDAISRAQEIIEEKNPSLKDKEAVAKMVANSAIKYFILSRNLKDDIVFDREQALSFEGNTGPYLQYTHARISGIYRKFTVGQGSEHVSALAETESNEQDLKVLRKLHQFPEIVERAARQYTPNTLTTYLYELSKEFNSFYEANPVLNAESESLKQLRMNIAQATAQVLKNGLSLLGIQAPDEM